MPANDRHLGDPSRRAPALVPREFFDADAAGIPLRAIFGIAGGSDDGMSTDRSLLIAQACLSGWLRHAHFGDLELVPSAEEFTRIETRRRLVFFEVAAVLARVEAAQSRAS
ncbi:hypothetical protein [Mitsuaria sp. 7]|uniref:hypothetical protein n=1 Tax=Mitsuaria sp. 7 TaxID=1658665 RepID=UPI0007DCFE7C|nr:hypothetical protein [Mitsuaria sp. 7]ANH67015.1 hypothetical protein ABE85_04510 [Mitsuaria sp. 7]